MTLSDFLPTRALARSTVSEKIMCFFFNLGVLGSHDPKFNLKKTQPICPKLKAIRTTPFIKKIVSYSLY